MPRLLAATNALGSAMGQVRKRMAPSRKEFDMRTTSLPI